MDKIYLDLCELRDSYWKLYHEEQELYNRGKGSERALWTAYGRYVGVVGAISALDGNGRI